MGWEIREIKLFIAAFFAFILIIGGGLYITGHLATANTLDESITGTGALDLRHDMSYGNQQTAGDIARVANAANIVYTNNQVWGTTDSDGYAVNTFSSTFDVHGASMNGGWMNAYAIKASGSGHKVVMQATKISGDASFASKITLTLNTGNGTTGLDSQINMDTMNGSAAITGRVYNSVAGRPATMEEMNAVGQYLITHHLNITLEQVKPDNWLGFCASLDKDMILDPSVPSGTYIAPPGYTLDSTGKLVRK